MSITTDIIQLKEKWAKEFPPSYAKFGDIQDLTHTSNTNIGN